MAEKEKKLFILSLPDAKGSEFQELLQSLRPFGREHNIILTSKRVTAAKLSDVRAVILKMLEYVIELQENAQKSITVADKPIPEATKEQHKEVREKINKILEEEKK